MALSCLIFKAYGNIFLIPFTMKTDQNVVNSSFLFILPCHSPWQIISGQLETKVSKVSSMECKLPTNGMLMWWINGVDLHQCFSNIWSNNLPARVWIGVRYMSTAHALVFKYDICKPNLEQLSWNAYDLWQLGIGMLKRDKIGIARWPVALSLANNLIIISLYHWLKSLV